MEARRRELLVARIVAGCIRCKVEDRRGRVLSLLIKPPTREQRYVAQELYEELLVEGELQGLYSEHELVDFLLENGFWDAERQTLLDHLPKEIEEKKLQLWKATFKSTERAIIRKALGVARNRFNQVHAERHAYDYLSADGSAAVARSRYLLGMGLHYPDGRPLFTDETFWEQSSDLLDQAVSFVARHRIDDAEHRELARTDPWRTFWSTRKSEGRLFGVPSCDYTEEQTRLVSYSLLFDSVFEHPECPDDSVVEDDDLLDGWLIDQRRKRGKDKTAKSGDELVSNEKIRNSQEVFLVADTHEDARKVDELNDGFASSIKRQRFDYLQKKGEVNELDMPDTRMRLNMELAQMLHKGGS